MTRSGGDVVVECHQTFSATPHKRAVEDTVILIFRSACMYITPLKKVIINNFGIFVR